MDRRHKRELRPIPGVAFGLAAASVTALMLGLAVFGASQPADALPSYAQQTGLGCGRCHVNPAGGGPRTSFGNAFLANGHKVPSAKKKQSKTSGGEAAPSPAPVTTAPTFVYNDYVRAGAWSLRHPYYSHFLYSADDYSH